MVAKTADINRLEEYYGEKGNSILVLYGRRGCKKEALIREFSRDKKLFYYRCREVSPEDQLRMMGEEISRQFDVKLQKYAYDEFFNRIRSGDASRLLVVIDEVQYVMKRDPAFFESILKLRAKRLYPGPVMIVLASSSIVWVEQDLKELAGEGAKKISDYIKIEDMNFLSVVRRFSSLPVSECVKIYGAIGGVPGYMELWDAKASFKENICSLVLTERGGLFDAAQELISSELRELSVYNTILSAIARGHNKLNDLFLTTGFSRAKISVYMKNLSHFDIVEKVESFQTGGWDNAKKGVYQIKDTYVNFWYKFVFPHLSDLYLLSASAFYDKYIAGELDEYLNRYFRNVCMEYLLLLDQLGRVPFPIHKIGTWVGKTGNLDIIAQSSDRQNIIGFCNWEKPMMTMDMCEEMALAMDQAKIKSEHFYLFSAKAFEPALVEYVKRDDRFELIDMNEL
ncbi:MAG: ATP-binding protein [Muribaculaceae bacterium]|nr:ATP-binding protein [Roseburia sp.]MCM1430475.1 ATP-binding protein [Muribaculaceae bacterium]MCM1493148.1 ATP-binding protein [Muribaculaceae bacterium]